MANFEETFSHRIPPIILEYYKEIFFNWIPEGEEAAVKEMAPKKIARYEEYSNHQLLQKGYLQNIPLETISYRLISAFCWIIMEKYDDSLIPITDVRENLTELKECDLISHGHYLGLLHLIQCLTTVRQYLLESSEFPEESQEHLMDLIKKSDSKRYDELPEMAHVAIKGVHAFFLRDFDLKRNKELVPLFKELATSDPDTIEWHLQHYRAMRLGRREGSDRFTPPSEGEKRLIEHCLKINRNHVLVKLSVCDFLCEVYATWKASPGEVIQLSDNIRLRKNEIVDFVKDTAKEIFDDQAMSYCVRINQALAEVFMKSFPIDARDPVMAKKCLLRALEIGPSRSKTNHKMGIWMMVYGKNYDEALKFISKAYNAKKKNYGALIDVIQLKMRNPDGNYDELMELFESSKDEKFEPSQRANLLVLLGVLHFVRGNPDGCISAWIEAFQLEEESTKVTLKGHYYRTQRYGWEQPEVAHLRKMLIEKKNEYPPDHQAIPYINLALEAILLPGHRGKGPNTRSYDNGRSRENSSAPRGQHTWRGRAMGGSTPTNFRSGRSDQRISESDSVSNWRK